MPKSSQSEIYRRLTSALRDARASQGLTQAEVARRLDKPQSFVAKYEQGERRIDVAELIAIAKALDIDPLKLFRRTLD